MCGCSNSSVLPRPGALAADEGFDPARVMEAPPEQMHVPTTVWSPTARLSKIDFVASDAANRDLGRRCEEFVVEFERRRLHDIERRPELSKQIELASRLDATASNVITAWPLRRPQSGPSVYLPTYQTVAAKLVSTRAPWHDLSVTLQRQFGGHLDAINELRPKHRADVAAKLLGCGDEAFAGLVRAEIRHESSVFRVIKTLPDPTD